jgi:hypothetical protein
MTTMREQTLSKDDETLTERAAGAGDMASVRGDEIDLIESLRVLACNRYSSYLWANGAELVRRNADDMVMVSLQQELSETMGVVVDLAQIALRLGTSMAAANVAS